MTDLSVTKTAPKLRLNVVDNTGRAYGRGKLHLTRSGFMTLCGRSCSRWHFKAGAVWLDAHPEIPCAICDRKRGDEEVPRG